MIPPRRTVAPLARFALWAAVAVAPAAGAQAPASAAAAPAATAPATVTPAAAPFTPQRFRAHVAFLADDLLAGRRTASPGHEIAARYVATQFESYGLQPGGSDGGWYQRIPFQRTEYVAGGSFATITGAAGEQRFAHGADVLVGINPREPSLDVSAPLVFVGYGVENALLGLDDYRGLDVRGKIVVALRGYPKGLPSEEGAHVSATKAEAAQKHGAIGIIGVDTLLSAKTRPWKRRIETANEASFDWVGPDGLAHVEAPGIRVTAAANDTAAAAIFAGAPRTLESIRREADRAGARPRGFPLKAQVRLQSQSTATRLSSPNVIGVLPGSDPVLAQQYVVLSAHLDHIGEKDPVPGEPPGTDRINNGALDNAAGIATMLEVARAAAAAPDRPRRSIVFLASTAEEEGLLGADYYARFPTVPIRQVVGNVDLDMPLLLYPFTDVIAFGADHSTFGSLVARAAGTMGIALAPDPMPQEGIFTRSDHYRFVRQGVPAVFLATGFANGGEKAWGEFLAGNYHHPGDDLAQAIDWDSGARFADVNYRITRAMADDDATPRWIERDFFGETFAPGAPRAPRAR
jgi:Zn-dependent M28 family amino/carboxypeptidase